MKSLISVKTNAPSTDNDIFGEETIERLFKRFYKPLRTYALRFVNERNIAEDIVQDVFCELWSRKTSLRLDEQEAMKSYLFKSVYHRSLNYLNSYYHEKRLILADDFEWAELQRITCVQPQEESLLQKELATEIRRCIDLLPPQCKAIFTLSRQHALKNGEIAEQLGISIKAVEKQITKALRTLREHLEKQGLL